MVFIVTREYIISLLQAWKESKITAADILNTASVLYHNDHDYDFIDWEQSGGWDNEDNHSVVHEVIQDLESLDTDLITQEGADSYIELLNTPIGQYEQGIKKFWEAQKLTTSFDERAKQLQGVHPYVVYYNHGK